VIEKNPKGPIQPRQPDARSLITSKNLQLVAKSHNLELQVGASPEAGKKAVNERNEDLAHDVDATRQHLERRGFLRRIEFMGGTPFHVELSFGSISDALSSHNPRKPNYLMVSRGVLLAAGRFGHRCGAHFA